jgi:hypothetical protein
MFLSIGGITQKDAQREFTAAYTRAAKTSTGRRVENIKYAIHHADAVALWMRDERFVDVTGRPRALSLRGKNGFTTLVRKVNPKADPSEVLSTLVRYGNVRRASNGQYRLVSPYFHLCTPKRVAFEPLTYFLSDASATLAEMLKKTKKSKPPLAFWRKAEKTGLPVRAVKEFSAFAQQRTLIFLEEIDEWLEAHSKNNPTNKNNVRVGLGIFSVHSKLGR